MNSPTLSQFLQAVAADPALQAQCGAVKDLAQLVHLAQTAGFAIRRQGAAHGVFSWPALMPSEGVLGQLQAAGFSEARMHHIASWKHGVLVIEAGR